MTAKGSLSFKWPHLSGPILKNEQVGTTMPVLAGPTRAEVGCFLGELGRCSQGELLVTLPRRMCAGTGPCLTCLPRQEA